jgi:hypothetical protein
VRVGLGLAVFRGSRALGKERFRAQKGWEGPEKVIERQVRKLYDLHYVYSSDLII